MVNNFHLYQQNIQLSLASNHWTPCLFWLWDWHKNVSGSNFLMESKPYLDVCCMDFFMFPSTNFYKKKIRFGYVFFVFVFFLFNNIDFSCWVFHSEVCIFICGCCYFTNLTLIDVNLFKNKSKFIWSSDEMNR